MEILARKKANLRKKQEGKSEQENEGEEDEETQDLLLMSLEKDDILTNVEEAEVNYVEKRLCTIRAYENGWISMTVNILFLFLFLFNYKYFKYIDYTYFKYI